MSTLVPVLQDAGLTGLTLSDLRRFLSHHAKARLALVRIVKWDERMTVAENARRLKMDTGQAFRFCKYYDLKVVNGRKDRRCLACRLQHRIHRLEKGLPSIFDLRGIAKGATGKLSSVEFVRKLRNASK